MKTELDILKEVATMFNYDIDHAGFRIQYEKLCNRIAKLESEQSKTQSDDSLLSKVTELDKSMKAFFTQGIVLPDYKQKDYSRDYLNGWNAYRSEIKRLNGL